MALRFKQGGYPLFTVTALAAVEAYEPTQYGDLLVIPQHDAVAGEAVAVHIPGAEGHFTGQAHAAITVAQGRGRKVYARIDGANAGRISSAAATARFIGYGLNNADVAAGGDIDFVTMGLAGI